MKVLTIKGDNVTSEVHALNPGGCFHGFGGSRNGLVVRKTASLIIRKRGADGVVEDLELDIHDADFWAWISRLINGHAGGVTAETPAKETPCA
jgi:hypothetical protein